jgi:hypothetical protein
MRRLAVAVLAALAAAAASVAVAPVPRPAEAADVPAGGTADELQAAIADLANGDTLVIEPGTYRVADLTDGTAGFVFSGKTGASLRAKKPGRVVIEVDADGPGLTADGLTDCAIEGIVFRAEVAPSAGSGLVIDASNGVTIRKCSFAGLGTAIEAGLVPRLLVESSKVADCGNGIRFDTTTAAPQPDDASFAVKRTSFLRVGGRGVDLPVDVSVVEFCRFSMLPGSVAAVISRPIYGDGAQQAIVKFNRIRGGGQGVNVQGDLHEVFSNKIARTGAEGIELGGGSEGYIGKNRVKRSGTAGLFIRTGGHVIELNKVKKSRTFDLLSEVPESANTYSKNKAKKTQFGM